MFVAAHNAHNWAESNTVCTKNQSLAVADCLFIRQISHVQRPTVGANKLAGPSPKGPASEDSFCAFSRSYDEGKQAHRSIDHRSLAHLLALSLVHYAVGATSALPLHRYPCPVKTPLAPNGSQ